MKYEELVAKIKDQFMKADVSLLKEHISYQFNIEGEAEGAFYAEISDGKLSIEPYEYYDRDVLFTTTAETLLEIAEGKLDAVEAFTKGRLKVEGDFEKALKLQEFTKGAAEVSNVKKAVVQKAAAVKNTVKKAADKKKAARAGKSYTPQ